MLEWIPEAVEAEQRYRRERAFRPELTVMRDRQAARGRARPLVPWWRRRAREAKTRRAGS